MLRFDIITIFPNIFDSYLKESFIKKAQDSRKISIKIHNLRDFTSDRHKTVDDRPFLLSLKVNPEDMGQIIGKAGSTARAIRNLVRIVGLKNHARVNLKIEEPEGGRVTREKKSEGLEDLKL